VHKELVALSMFIGVEVTDFNTTEVDSLPPEIHSPYRPSRAIIYIYNESFSSSQNICLLDNQSRRVIERWFVVALRRSLAIAWSTNARSRRGEKYSEHNVTRYSIKLIF